MTAKEFLWSIRSEDLELKTLGEQIKHTRQEAEGVRAMQLSDMPKGGKGVDVAALLAEVVDLQTIYFEKARAIVRKRKLATDIIMTMDSVEQKSVLSLRYLCGKSWDDIVDIMHYAYSGVYKLHGAALQEFAKKYDSCERVELSGVK